MQRDKTAALSETEMDSWRLQSVIQSMERTQVLWMAYILHCGHLASISYAHKSFNDPGSVLVKGTFKVPSPKSPVPPQCLCPDPFSKKTNPVKILQLCFFFCTLLVQTLSD